MPLYIERIQYLIEIFPVNERCIVFLPRNAVLHAYIHFEAT